MSRPVTFPDSLAIKVPRRVTFLDRQTFLSRRATSLDSSPQRFTYVVDLRYHHVHVFQ
jgi:hypothetical protein